MEGISLSVVSCVDVSWDGSFVVQGANRRLAIEQHRRRAVRHRDDRPDLCKGGRSREGCNQPIANTADIQLRQAIARDRPVEAVGRVDESPLFRPEAELAAALAYVDDGDCLLQGLTAMSESERTLRDVIVSHNDGC